MNAPEFQVLLNGMGNNSELELDILAPAFSTATDIYDVGRVVIPQMIYGNAPVTGAVERPVPPPLNKIVEACTRDLPEERPTLDELYAMVERIGTC